MSAPVPSPLQAPSSADPYPGYRKLVQRGLFFDESLQLWIAAGAEAVTAAFMAPALGVRPSSVPIPPALTGTAAGQVFGRLVRMTDGSFHSTVKPLVSSALGGADTARAAEVAREAATAVLRVPKADTIRRLMFDVPAAVVGQLCGLPSDVDVAGLTRAFVRCIPASADEADVRAASPAATELSRLLAPLLADEAAGLTGGLARAARLGGFEDTAALLANAIGLLSQTYDATAGLIGNTLLAVARDGAGHDVDEAYLLEVARHDAPIQNTRRFAHANLQLGGTEIRAGQAVLLVLAAANRDPSANPDPDTFRRDRERPALFTFGLGAHSCPGRLLSVVIATSVVRAACESAELCTASDVSPRYLPLANARIPEL